MLIKINKNNSNVSADTLNMIMKFEYGNRRYECVFQSVIFMTVLLTCFCRVLHGLNLFPLLSTVFMAECRSKCVLLLCVTVTYCVTVEAHGSETCLSLL